MIIRSNGILQARHCSARTSQTFIIPFSKTQSSASFPKVRPNSLQGTRASSYSRAPYKNPPCILESPVHLYRAFATSAKLQKQKKGRSSRNEDTKQEDQGSHGNRGGSKKDGRDTNPSLAPVSDIINLSSFKAEAQQVQEKLRKGLASLKPGGRFDPALIETIRVDISKLQPDNDAAQEKSHAKAIKNDDSTPVGGQPASGLKKEKRIRGSLYTKPTVTANLTDMAQVIPRGAKTVIIMLNEEAFAKPVMSALLGSKYSLVPSVSPTNPLELIVPIPPPSAELRANTLNQVDKLRERAEIDLRDRRAGMQKELRALQLSVQIGPDTYYDTHKKMDKVMDEMKAELKRLCDASRKVLQQS